MSSERTKDAVTERATGSGGRGRAPLLDLLFRTGIAVPATMLALGLLVALSLVSLLFTGVLSGGVALAMLLPAIAVAIAGGVLGGWRLHRGLLAPLVRVEQQVSAICEGEPDARLSLVNVGVLKRLVRDIDSINEELSDLYEDMDNRVARQTTRLAQKTASLKILYDVAANINRSRDRDDMLLRFMRILKEMVSGVAATVSIRTPTGMQPVGCIGLDDLARTGVEEMEVARCQCGASISCGDVVCDHPERYCQRQLGRTMFSADEVERITVPLEFQDEVLGEYSLSLHRPGVSAREDILDLLKTVGSHLGVALAKQRSDAEAQRLSILDERNALAHELHDSLAQTLASLRFQVRLLEDSLRAQYLSTAVRDDLGKIRSGIDQAHTELRELLNSFRAPVVDTRGLLSGLQELVRQFREATGVHVFFQDEIRRLELPEAEEVQIMRIAQEALANVRKHAGAHTVRVLVTRCRNGELRMLIEDDGVGFDTSGREQGGAEHIGLAVMQERAERLGGELRIESEPGEGTRVELIHRPSASADSGGRQEAV